MEKILTSGKAKEIIDITQDRVILKNLQNLSDGKSLHMVWGLDEEKQSKMF